jgi:nucleoid-associated protein YgaU
MPRTIKRLAATTISLALALVMLLSLPAWAQNLAEAARQERERRKALATHHVYTNDDLAKARILVPEDQARVEAHNTVRSSPVVVVAIDASQPSSPLPIPTIKLASQAPFVLRGAMTVPTPPNPPAATVTSSIEALATEAVQLSFPFAESFRPPLSQHISGNEAQAPLVVAVAEGGEFPASTLAVDAPVTLPAPISFPSAQSSAHNIANRSAWREPSTPAIAYPVATSQTETIRSGVRLGFPGGSAAPSAVPKETVVAEHSLATAPAIHPASCTGTCSGLAGIVSPQPVVTARPVADIQTIQSAISSKPESIKPIESESIKPRRVPVNASPSQVRVAIGDSLWKLAKRYLGDGKHWRELATLNHRLPNPGLIRAGELIQLPAKAPEQARQVVVQPGDSLWTVAETALGSPLAFNCIAHANPQLQSANVIHPGETLLVPETCAVEPVEKDRAGAL